jgi:hypothetical protein
MLAWQRSFFFENSFPTANWTKAACRIEFQSVSLKRHDHGAVTKPLFLFRLETNYVCDCRSFAYYLLTTIALGKGLGHPLMRCPYLVEFSITYLQLEAEQRIRSPSSQDKELSIIRARIQRIKFFSEAYLFRLGVH